MIELPASTIVNRFLSKEKFFSKTNVNTKIRQYFTDEVEKIIWKNKISPSTLNITTGDYTELQVFEIALKGSDVNVSVLKHIDTYIPYPILFIIKKQGASNAVISFKESALKNQDNMKVDSYFGTGWRQDINLELKGRSVDEIYKNFLYQIAPQLKNANQTTAKIAIEVNKEREKIQKQIDAINRQITNEPSIAKKQELARIRRRLEEGVV
jgi:hypothetical protein